MQFKTLCVPMVCMGGRTRLGEFHEGMSWVHLHRTIWAAAWTGQGGERAAESTSIYGLTDGFWAGQNPIGVPAAYSFPGHRRELVDYQRDPTIMSSTMLSLSLHRLPNQFKVLGVLGTSTEVLSQRDPLLCVSRSHLRLYLHHASKSFPSPPLLSAPIPVSAFAFGPNPRLRLHLLLLLGHFQTPPNHYVLRHYPPSTYINHPASFAPFSHQIVHPFLESHQSSSSSPFGEK
ncbi:uncharacterized protein LAJ45_01964 [Morchella importuna]|uniref:uncharacterized protein n=1 Tax=Morchella importuna TaxID=1174673 RepID=UPI001E8D9E40|nr:uncharacterized protein LAJ45_01964 [Morchella importuna]KAH8154196.1 hypothetical protein LAJ45_01964 [Morchella importuna]